MPSMVHLFLYEYCRSATRRQLRAFRSDSDFRGGQTDTAHARARGPTAGGGIVPSLRRERPAIALERTCRDPLPAGTYGDLCNS